MPLFIFPVSEQWLGLKKNEVRGGLPSSLHGTLLQLTNVKLFSQKKRRPFALKRSSPHQNHPPTQTINAPPRAPTLFLNAFRVPTGSPPLSAAPARLTWSRRRRRRSRTARHQLRAPGEPEVRTAEAGRRGEGGAVDGGVRARSAYRGRHGATAGPLHCRNASTHWGGMRCTRDEEAEEEEEEEEEEWKRAAQPGDRRRGGNSSGFRRFVHPPQKKIEILETKSQCLWHSEAKTATEPVSYLATGVSWTLPRRTNTTAQMLSYWARGNFFTNLSGLNVDRLQPAT